MLLGKDKCYVCFQVGLHLYMCICVYVYIGHYSGIWQSCELNRRLTLCCVMLCCGGYVI